MRVLVTVAAMAMLAGCAQADPGKLAQLQSGKSTVAEAVAVLGSPDRDETLPDGSRMLTYLGSRTLPSGYNALPVAVYVWGGWHTRTDEAGLMFAPDGVLRFYSWSGDSAKQMRNIGQAVSPYAGKAPETQGPPPVSGQGAETLQHDGSAN